MYSVVNIGLLPLAVQLQADPAVFPILAVIPAFDDRGLPALRAFVARVVDADPALLLRLPLPVEPRHDHVVSAEDGSLLRTAEV